MFVPIHQNCTSPTSDSSSSNSNFCRPSLKMLNPNPSQTSTLNEINERMNQRQKEWQLEVEKLRQNFFAQPPPIFSPEIRRSQSSLSSFSNPFLSPPRSPLKCLSPAGEEFCVEFDLKGFLAEEIKVEVTERNLTVLAQHKEQGKNLRIARSFERRVEIPSCVDTSSLRFHFTPDNLLVVSSLLQISDCSLHPESPVDIARKSPHSLEISQLRTNILASENEPVNFFQVVKSPTQYFTVSNQQNATALYELLDRSRNPSSNKRPVNCDLGIVAAHQFFNGANLYQSAFAPPSSRNNAPNNLKPIYREWNPAVNNEFLKNIDQKSKLPSFSPNRDLTNNRHSPKTADSRQDENTFSTNQNGNEKRTDQISNGIISDGLSDISRISGVKRNPFPGDNANNPKNNFKNENVLVTRLSTQSEATNTILSNSRIDSNGYAQNDIFENNKINSDTNSYSNDHLGNEQRADDLCLNKRADGSNRPNDNATRQTESQADEIASGADSSRERRNRFALSLNVGADVTPDLLEIDASESHLIIRIKERIAAVSSADATKNSSDETSAASSGRSDDATNAAEAENSSDDFERGATKREKGESAKESTSDNRRAIEHMFHLPSDINPAFLVAQFSDDGFLTLEYVDNQ